MSLYGMEFLPELIASSTDKSKFLLATARDYIRDTQTQVILKPIADYLRSAFPSQQLLEQYFQSYEIVCERAVFDHAAMEEVIS